MIGVEATRRLLARPVLLVAPGGEPPGAAAVLGHVAANRGATAARGITETAQEEEKSINMDIRDRAVSEESVRAEAEPGLRLVVRASASFFGVHRATRTPVIRLIHALAWWVTLTIQFADGAATT